MKKLFVMLTCALFLSACGGSGTSDEQTEAVTPELQSIQKSSDDIKAKSDALDQKADSILNNI